MGRFLFIILIILSALEIGVFIWLGNLFGGWFVVFGIILTGMLGIYLARRQGLEVLNRARSQMNYGQFPHDEIFDGICILIGAILLFLPGFITDALGILLLLPFTREPLKVKLKNFLAKLIQNGKIIYFNNRRF